MSTPTTATSSRNIYSYGSNGLNVNSAGGQMEWWSKQPQATQQHVPAYNEQYLRPPNTQAPGCAELRATRQQRPEMNGQASVRQRVTM